MNKNIYVKSNNAERKIMHAKSLLQQTKIIDKPNKIKLKSKGDKITLYKQKSMTNRSMNKKINKINKNYQGEKNCNNCGKAIYILNSHLLEDIGDLCSCTDSAQESSSFIVTSITTPMCVDKYMCDEDSFDEQIAMDNHCEQNLCCKQLSYLCKNISTINMDSIQNKLIDNDLLDNTTNTSNTHLGSDNFIMYLQQIIDELKAFIILLGNSNGQNDVINIEHEKLLELYNFENEMFNFNTNITIYFITALKVYGKYIANINDYDNTNDIIVNLNKINCNQNDILNIVLSYQK